MNIYLIAFQMVSGERRNALVSHIKEYGIWARITESVWCIKVADKTTAEIRDFLNAKSAIQSDERLIVINITNSSWASYYIPKDVAGWLKEK